MTIKRDKARDEKHIWRKRNGFLSVYVSVPFLWQDGFTLHSLAKWTFAQNRHKWSWIRTLQSTNDAKILWPEQWHSMSNTTLAKLQSEIFKRINIQSTEAKCIIARRVLLFISWTCTSPRPCRPAGKHRNNDKTLGNLLAKCRTPDLH